MVLVERQGVPLGICLAPASPAEVTLVDATLAARLTPHRRKPHRLVGDRGDDSDGLRERLATRGITLISPYRDNRVNRPYEVAGGCASTASVTSSNGRLPGSVPFADC